MKERYYGIYAIYIYLPFSSLSRWWRRFSNRFRGKRDRFLWPTRLPGISWRRCVLSRVPRVWEHRQQNGNVRISELGILSALAEDCEQGTNIFEIGTFDGRTTLNLALNSPPGCRVYTLDLPPGQGTRYQMEDGENYIGVDQRPGSRYEKIAAIFPVLFRKIQQLSEIRLP